MDPSNKHSCAIPMLNISISCGSQEEQCEKQLCTFAVGNFFFAAQGDYTFTRKVFYETRVE